MPPLAGIVSTVASLIVVVFVGRAMIKLLQDPEEDHDELVPTWERRATTVVGVPLLLVAASTMTNGPLAVPYDPLPLFFAGVVLTAYPNFTPSSLG